MRPNMADLSCQVLCVCVLLSFQSVLCQFGFLQRQQDHRRHGTPFQFSNILDPSRIRNTLTGFLHLSPEDKNTNSAFVYPFRRPGITYDVNNNQNYPNQDGGPVKFPNSAPNFGNQNNYGQTSNVYPPNIGNQYPPSVQYQGREEVPYDHVNFEDYKPTVINQLEDNSPSGVHQRPESPQAIPNIPPSSNIPQTIPNVPPTTNTPQRIPNVPPTTNTPQEILKVPPTTNTPQGIPNVPPTANIPQGIPKEPPTSNIPQGIPNKPPYSEASQGTIKTPSSEVISTAPPNSQTELPMLTPVPDSEKRNNFNFGTHGIFQETCQTADNRIGSCVNLFQCEPYLKVVQESRSNPEAVQLLRKVHCGFEGNNPKVCCPRKGIPTAPPTEPNTQLKPVEPEPIEPEPIPVDEPEKPAEGKTLSDDFVTSLPQPPVCGVSNASFSRVIGGVDAHLGDFPWMAILGYKPRRGSGARWLCGGTLVTSKHVLTAAHCIHLHEDDLFVVRLGELDLAKDDEGATPTDVLIKKMIKHEEYSANAYTNDIGILLLDKEVQFTDLIRPICLPTSTELRARNFENYNPIITGWGTTEFRGPSATHLQALQLPVVSTEFCAEAYSQYKAQKIDEKVICAGYKGGKDACQGDSGGPLMQPIWDPSDYTTYFYQIGVVSYGKKCAEAGFPGVYSRVTYFVPWLTEKLLGTA
ncbi:LOW QUALITY PROTEIN: clip domain serine protease 4 [Aphomia sociella]